MRHSRRIAVLCPNLRGRWGVGGHRELDGILRRENPLPPPGFKTLDTKPLASRYIDYGLEVTLVSLNTEL